jgi:hypothetical protein
MLRQLAICLRQRGPMLSLTFHQPGQPQPGHSDRNQPGRYNGCVKRIQATIHIYKWKIQGGIEQGESNAREHYPE